MDTAYLKDRFIDFEMNNMKATNMLIFVSLLLLFLVATRSIIVVGLVTTGVIPLFSTQGVSSIYSLLSSSVVLLSLYYLFTQQKLIYPNNIKLILYFNLIVMSVWLIPEMLIGRRNTVFFAVAALLPFSIFAFMQIPRRLFNRVIILLILIAVLATILDFQLANNPLTSLFRERLRETIDPGVLAPTRTGAWIRAVGITGSEHDTGCMLVMMITFLLAIRKDTMSIPRPIAVALIYLSYTALILTLSLTNMLVIILISLFFIVYYLRRKSFFRPLILITPLLGLLFYSMVDRTDPRDIPNMAQENFFEAITRKATSRDVWTSFGIVIEPDLGDEALAVLVGHNQLEDTDAWGYQLEFAFVRLLYQTGLVVYLFLLAVLFFPLLLYFRADQFTKKQMFPYVCTTIAGLLTLAHYGSLLRFPDIFIFFAFYGQGIRQYTLSSHYYRYFLSRG